MLDRTPLDPSYGTMIQAKLEQGKVIQYDSFQGLSFYLVGVDTSILESFGIQRLYNAKWLTDQELHQIWNIFIGYTGTPNHMILEGRPSGVKLIFRYTTSRQAAQVSFLI